MQISSRLLLAAPIIRLALPAFPQASISFELNQNCANLNLCGSTTAAVQADFNNDGKPDLLTEDGSNQILNLRLGRGDETFEAPVQVGFIHQNASGFLLTVDRNSDGIPDLVASSYNSATIDVLLGKSGGTFGPTTSQ